MQLQATTPPNFCPSVRKEYESPSEIVDFRGALVRVVRLERTVSWSQRRSNLVLHVHELHLALSTPGILLSGALFSTVSTSSGGGCGQLCGRMEMLPWIAADSPSPGSVWIVALFCQIVKAVLDISTLTFCVAVDKEIRNHGTQPSFSQSSVFAAISRMISAIFTLE